jgi:hypothetical protein
MTGGYRIRRAARTGTVINALVRPFVHRSR